MILIDEWLSAQYLNARLAKLVYPELDSHLSVRLKAMMILA